MLFVQPVAVGDVAQANYVNCGVAFGFRLNERDG